MRHGTRPFFIFFAFVFFLALPPNLNAQDKIPSTLELAYKNILSLKFSKGTRLLDQSKDFEGTPFYILTKCYYETLYLLIYEDQNYYQKNKGQYYKKIKELKYTSGTPAWKLLTEAEIRFQYGLLKLKFNDELSAAWELRQVYQIIQNIEKKYPDFIHHKKLMGLFHIFLGSVPEKYTWLTNLFGYKGNIAHGIKFLSEIENSSSIFRLEAYMIKMAAKKYIIKSSECLSCQMQPFFEENKDNYLLGYLYSAILVKEGRSSRAFEALSFYDHYEYPKFPLAYLLKGEILLYRGDYLQSRAYLNNFLEYTKGQNHIKDAHYKIFLTYWLEGNETKASYYFKLIPKVGQNIFDADKYAERFAGNPNLPDKHLMIARLRSDGGYWEEALLVLSKYCLKKPENHKDNIEFWYRKGRIYQLTGKKDESIKNYKKAIALSEQKSFYFAPNACLQIGYMLVEEGSKEEAMKYFKRALAYQDHEYKNSIDNKAKAAINDLE